MANSSALLHDLNQPGARERSKFYPEANAGYPAPSRPPPGNPPPATKMAVHDWGAQESRLETSLGSGCGSK